MSMNTYSVTQILLHWISAAVIVWALVSGFYAGLLSPGADIKAWVSFVNVSLTTLFIPLFIWRLYLFIARRGFRSSSSRSRGEWLAVIVHQVMYLLISVVLVTGVLMMNRDIEVFNIFTIAQPLNDTSWIKCFEMVHIASCMALSALVILHIAAVLKHEFMGAGVIHKMLLKRSWSRSE